MKERYNRQILLAGIGQEGQEKLKKAKVLVIGAGGLGSPVIQYLAGAGIGKLGIVDADNVDVSNIHRQVIHNSQRVGMNKAESAKESVQNLNAEVEVVVYPFLVDENNIQAIVSEYDFVVDCVDNFEGKFLINDICVQLKKPFCHAGVVGYQGQVLTYVPGKGPCYRCIFEDIPEEGTVPTSRDIGILGPAAGIFGCIQAAEAIKYFTGAGELLTGRMYILDTLTMTGRCARFPKPSPTCKACGKN